MASETKDPREMWVQWTRDAVSKYVPPEKVDDTEELVDDMIEFTSQYASGMLDAFEETFGEESEGRAPARSRARKGKPERD